MSATATLARFASDLRYEDIPVDLRQSIKLHIIDSLCCGVAGGWTESTMQLTRFARAEHAGGSCPVFGSASRLGPVAAALVNAGAMNALDFDDGLEFDGRGMGHPGATIVAAALSAIWDRQVSGAEFITAVAAAYEVNARVILSMQPSFERFRDVYGVCQHQGIAAALAYGRLVGIDAVGLENALGLAGTLACVPSLRKYNWEARPLVSLKDFNAPAAEGGVRAVRLHGAGLIGARNVLDGEHGLWRMLGSDRFDAHALLDCLGDDWLARNASFKLFPTCRWMQTALESFRTVRDAHDLRAHEIEAITVLSFSGMARDFMDAAPSTAIDAQFSLPFALATLTLGDHPAAHWYTPDTLRDPGLLSMAKRVQAVTDPRFEAEMTSARRRPAGQVVVSARGRDLHGPALIHPLGSRERPASDASLLAKFADNLAPARDTASIVADLMTMDEHTDMGALVAGLVSDQRPMPSHLGPSAARRSGAST